MLPFQAKPLQQSHFKVQSTTFKVQSLSKNLLKGGPSHFKDTYSKSCSKSKTTSKKNMVCQKRCLRWMEGPEDEPNHQAACPEARGPPLGAAMTSIESGEEPTSRAQCWVWVCERHGVCVCASVCERVMAGEWMSKRRNPGTVLFVRMWTKRETAEGNNLNINQIAVVNPSLFLFWRERI